ncbi:MAG: hypothetical protein AB9919_06885 [Geobacteraceae bacterium]
MAFDDLDIFFGDFAATATVGISAPISVIFDAPYKGISIETNEIEGYAPAATAKSSDVAALSIAHGTAISISGTPGSEYDGDYTVIGIEPDGQGLTKLILERQ